MGNKPMERTIPVRIPDEILRDIDAERNARKPAAPSRSQMIRELLARALKTGSKK